MAATSTVRVRRKRTTARAAGFCARCCARAARPERTTCELCSEATKRRVERMRERRRPARQASSPAFELETAGDDALRQHRYGDAAEHYSRALASPHEAMKEALLCEKLAQAIFYGARPDHATAVYERALRLYTEAGRSREVAVVLRALSRQCWLESRTIDAVAIDRRAAELAACAPAPELMTRMNVAISNDLQALGRHAEAIANMAKVRSSMYDPPPARAVLYGQRAMVDAFAGNARAAFAGFRRSIELARTLEDGNMITSIWDDYANSAMELGRIDVARACRERALFVARERGIAWRISYMALRYTRLLITAGELTRAREVYADAVTYDTNAPVVTVLRATAEAELARYSDEPALARWSADRTALELAFRSGEHARIASIAAAYAGAYIRKGRISAARALISRALAIVSRADDAMELIALVARYGSRTDVDLAEGLLARRLAVPSAGVAEAYGTLCAAYRLQRSGSHGPAAEQAERAAELFLRMGWRDQYARARALVGPHATAAVKRPNRTDLLLGGFRPALTAREQEVADLALTGMTNRAIAQALSIREHTVESHMTSILNRLGIRSRWQLLDLPE